MANIPPSGKFRTHIRWNTKVISGIEGAAQKSLVALGGRICQRAIKNISIGENQYPPAVDTGRYRASMSVNWSKSKRTSSEVFRADLSLGQPLGNVMDIAKGTNDAVGQPDSKLGRFTVVIGTNVPYAPHVEFGTIRMGARPHLQLAYQSKIKSAAKDIAKGIKVTYGGFWKKPFTANINL